MKKGFTLVELLAVIVVLAVILVIAVPNVLNIIEKSKKNSFETTAKMMGNVANKIVASDFRYAPTLSGRAKIIPWEALQLDKVDKDVDGGSYNTSESYVVVVNYARKLYFFVTLKGSKRSVDRQEDKSIIVKKDTVVSETKVGESYDFGNFLNVLVEAVPNGDNSNGATPNEETPATQTGNIDVDATNIALALEVKVSKGMIDIATFTKEDLDSIGVDSSFYDGFGVSIVNDKVVVTLAKGNEIGENRLNNKVYGVIFNGTSSTLTRTDDAIGLSTTATETNITSDFDNAEIYNEFSQETDTYGNVFIRIPKFWIKKTNEGNTWTYQISRTKQDEGYYLPACFYDEESGKIVPYVLVGKYDASLSGDKLESKSGKTVQIKVRKTIIDYRDYAKNNNIGSQQGYQLLDIHVMDIIQTLFYVEFATLDSQSIMAGFTTGVFMSSPIVLNASNKVITFQTSGGASNFRVGQIISVGTTVSLNERLKDARVVTVDTINNQITYEVIPGITQDLQTIIAGDKVKNSTYLTGVTNSVGGNLSSGSPTSNIDGKYAMKYRGIENVWGNINQYIDGVNIYEHQTYVSRNANSYESDKYDGDYVSLSYQNSTISGNAAIMGYDPNNPFIQLPISVLVTSYYKDQYSGHTTSKKVLAFGGSWSDGRNAGVSNWNITQDTSDSQYGARLVKVPILD